MFVWWKWDFSNPVTVFRWLDIMFEERRVYDHHSLITPFAVGVQPAARPDIFDMPGTTCEDPRR